MALRFTSLGSGSSGNALVVESGGTRVMMDCGFATSDTKLRLERAGLAPGDLAAIVVTHDLDLAKAVADRVAVLIDGRFAAMGTTAEVTAASDAAVQAFLAGEARP